MIIAVGVSLLTLYFPAWFDAWPSARNDQDAAIPTEQGVGDSEAALWLPKTTLVHPRNGGHSKLTPEQYSARLQTLRQSMSDTGRKGVERAAAALAAANLVISRGISEPGTRRLLDLATETDAVALRTATDEAVAFVRSAQHLLTRETTTGESEAGRLADLQRIAAMIECFASTISTTAGEPLPPVEQIRALSLRLGVMTESDEVAVRESSLLWSAQLSLSLPSREQPLTLAELPPAWRQPEEDHQTTGLLLRLKRCELLAEHGRFATAIALLNRLEVDAPTWFADADATAARHTVALFQLRILSAWDKAAVASGSPQTRAWIRQRYREITARNFPEGQGSLLILDPLVAEMSNPVGNNG